MPYSNQTHFIVATKNTGEVFFYAVINNTKMLIKDVTRAAYLSESEARDVIKYDMNKGFTFTILPNSEREKYYSCK